MSVQAMAAVFSRSRLGGTTRLTLLALANYYGDRGAWPSIDSLARDCLMSRRAVQDCLRRAEAAGELHVELNAGSRGTNRYWLHLDGEGCSFCTSADDRRQSASEPSGTRGSGSENGSSPQVPTLMAPPALARSPQKPPSSPRPRDLIFEALEEAFGKAPVGRLRGSWQTATKELRDSGSDPDEIRRLVDFARGDRETAWRVATPTALAKHLGQLRRIVADRPLRPYDHFDYGAFSRGKEST